MDHALNEADVLGVRLAADGRCCDLLMHVLALPEDGPIDSDHRRIVRLKQPSRVAVLLRATRFNPSAADPQVGTEQYGPVIPLADLPALEAFFGSLNWGGSMYGREFLDNQENAADWPNPCSLEIRLTADQPLHSIYWFNECGRDEAGGPVRYLLEGVVTFDDIEVLRASGVVEPVEQFVADADRWWDAMYNRDARLSVAAQRAASATAPSWRPWALPEGRERQ